MQPQICDADWFVRAAQLTEQRWWGAATRFANAQEVADAVAKGILIRVSDTELYRVSSQCSAERHALRQETLLLLEAVAVGWMEMMRTRRCWTPGLYLLLTSLIRPIDYHEKLFREGVAPSRWSSHQSGLAFDVSYAWFRKSYPKGEDCLRDVLRQMAGQGFLNLIENSKKELFHISPSCAYATQKCT